MSRPTMSLSTALQALALCLLLSSTPAVAQKLTLQEALSLALDGNPGLQVQRGLAEQGRNTLVLKTGYLLPQVSLSGNATYGWWHDIGSTPPANPAMSTTFGDYAGPSLGASVGVSWTLFDGLRMFRARELVQSGADLAQVKAGAAEANLRYQVLVAYGNLVTQQALLRTAALQSSLSRPAVPMRLSSNRRRVEKHSGSCQPASGAAWSSALIFLSSSAR